MTPRDEVPPPDATIRIEVSKAETLYESDPGEPAEPPGATVSLPEGVRFGRYEDTRVIGRGGMGTILEAVDPHLERQVALKVLLAEAPEESIERRKFLMEAKLAGRLEHPNIVPVHELGSDSEGRPFFSMKLVRGQSLEKLLESLAGKRRAERGEWTRTRLLSIYLKVLDAVAFAHSQRVIHRDLKPANIMVGEFGEVLLADWGLARLLDHADVAAEPVRVDPLSASDDTVLAPLATADGTVMGTPAYMSPEQAQGDVARIDERSDIFALGAILYEILTLTPPFQGDSALTMIARAGRGQLEAPSRRAPGESIPRELEAAVLKAMALRMDDRYQSALELRADIEAYLEGRTLAAARYNPLQRTVKWALRHRLASGITVMGLALSTAFYGVYEWRRREDRAVQEREVLSERDRLAGELSAARARLSDLSPADPAELLQANGEPKVDSVRALYSAYSSTLDLLDRLAALDENAPTERARQAIDREAIDRERRRLCLEAAQVAVRLGDDPLAGLWVDRAEAAGLDGVGREAALRRIDATRRARIGADLAAARKVLDASLSWSETRQAFEYAVTDLVRLKSPDLVRLILDGGYLDSRNDIQRRLVIATLGRLGDTQTVGADGLDAVGRLSRMLSAVDPGRDLETAVALAEALGHLGDARAHDAFRECRDRSGDHSSFRHRTEAPYERVPVPAEILPGGARGPRTAEEYSDLGLLYFMKRRFPEALEALGRAVELEPGNARMLVNRGNAYLALGELDRARSDYTAALEIDSTLALAYSSRGVVHLRTGELEEAVADFGRALELQPDLTDALVNRAVACSTLGRHEEALRDYDRALAAKPDLAIALSGRGTVRHAKGDLEGALADLDAAIRLNPSYPNAYNHRGLVYCELDRHDEAIADFTRALELAPQAGIYTNRGMARARRGDLEMAVQDFDAALELDVAFAGAYVNRALVKSQLGDEAGAAADHDRAVEAVPDEPSVVHSRGRFHARRGESEAAILDYSRAIELAPSWVEPWFWRAVARRDGGDPEGAVADYDRVLELDPARRDALIDRGGVRFELGDQEGGIADQTRAIELDPGDFEALSNRGVMRQAKGDPDGAIADFARAVAIRRDAWKLWYTMGVLYAQGGRRDEALAALRTALETAPPEGRDAVREALQSVERGG